MELLLKVAYILGTIIIIIVLSNKNASKKEQIKNLKQRISDYEKANKISNAIDNLPIESVNSRLQSISDKKQC